MANSSVQVTCPLCGACWLTAATNIGTVIACVQCSQDIHPVVVGK